MLGLRQELMRQDMKSPPGFRSCCVTGGPSASPSRAPLEVARLRVSMPAERPSVSDESSS